MTTDYTGAISDIYSRVKLLNETNAALLVGYPLELRYTPEQKNAPPDATKIWARVSIQTVGESQATFGTYQGPPGAKMYISVGLVYIQVFVPKSTDGAGTKLRLLAAMFRNGFRGIKTLNGIVFRNARIHELPDEETYFRFNVVTEFDYSEIF